MRLRILSKDMQRINMNARLAKWRRWFAWHPVRLAPDDVRWLEWIERRGSVRLYDGKVFWEHRQIMPAGGPDQ